jgi:hypothetical protein
MLRRRKRWRKYLLLLVKRWSLITIRLTGIYRVFDDIEWVEFILGRSKLFVAVMAVHTGSLFIDDVVVWFDLLLHLLW